MDYRIYGLINDENEYCSEVVTFSISRERIQRILTICKTLIKGHSAPIKTWDHVYGKVTGNPFVISSSDFTFSSTVEISWWGIELEYWVTHTDFPACKLGITRENLQDLLKNHSTWVSNTDIEEMLENYGIEDMLEMVSKDLRPSLWRVLNKYWPEEMEAELASQGPDQTPVQYEYSNA